MPAPKKRPKSGRNLGIVVMLRAETADQKRRWQVAASKAGLTLAAWLRGLADGAS
jgi:hypothetical protein